MDTVAAIAVLGTFDSKAEEHIFLKEQIEQRRLNSECGMRNAEIAECAYPNTNSRH